MYQLLIVDDEPLVQVGIKSMLDWTELGIEICGTAMNGQAALKIIEEKHPDIVITDIKMPVMNGLELAKECLERYGEMRPYFIILTSYEDFQMAKAALTYHVSDYLVKLELTPDLLKESVRKGIYHVENSGRKAQNGKADSRPFYDKFFISLLHNLFSSKEQFLLQCQDLNLNFDYQSYVCCYGEITSSTADILTPEKQSALFRSSLHMLKELTGKYPNIYALPLDTRHFALIFCYETICSETTACLEDILRILENIRITMHNYYNVSLLYGIGSLEHSPETISESYHHSRQAFAAATEENPLSCFTRHPAGDFHRHSFNISLFRDDLITAFEEYNADALEEVVRSLCELFLAHPKYYLQAMDAACNILYLSISLLQDGESIVAGFFQNNADGYLSIYKKSNMEQVVDWLTYFTGQMAKFFRDHKRDHKNHIVINVRKYIQSHIHERLSLNEVAAVFSINPSYLSQLFRKYNELGFSEYINTCKIRESKRLLKEENLKIYEVAEMLGFESPFYFSKVFKKIEGISPTEYLNTK